MPCHGTSVHGIEFTCMCDRDKIEYDAILHCIKHKTNNNKKLSCS